LKTPVCPSNHWGSDMPSFAGLELLGHFNKPLPNASSNLFDMLSAFNYSGFNVTLQRFHLVF
jgi:hypothetical protein